MAEVTISRDIVVDPSKGADKGAANGIKAMAFTATLVEGVKFGAMSLWLPLVPILIVGAVVKGDPVMDLRWTCTKIGRNLVLLAIGGFGDISNSVPGAAFRFTFSIGNVWIPSITLGPPMCE
jgi:hypothetical protein